ncbi:MAG: hypothetical protein A2289_04705 [Deltaproteobacteria bacterium RIFOXYA12_FULL_58_15]|nr:MAG: hypothetical protein A2289_04705 [Deltaproteobacteria bacterium RIFOXYA12_FULL_58_15]OGR09894.1 MAG: hypothetical protein A2341_27255 [Deltaproteobacteria bacterium RIFOXYB12_FULL_58_9]
MCQRPLVQYDEALLLARQSGEMTTLTSPLSSALVEVDVIPTEAPELACPHAGVDRGGIQGNETALQ